LNERPAQLNMNEEKKDKKTERLGIIAIATAGLCWLSVLGTTPFEFIYLLPVSTIAAMLSLKNILSKMTMALLVLLAPGYLVTCILKNSIARNSINVQSTGTH
jgi:hypothetical protein